MIYIHIYIMTISHSKRGGMITHDFVFVPVNLGTVSKKVGAGKTKRKTGAGRPKTKKGGIRRGGYPGMHTDESNKPTQTDLWNQLRPHHKEAIKSFGKDVAIHGAKQLAKGAAVAGAAVGAKHLYNKFKNRKKK